MAEAGQGEAAAMPLHLPPVIAHRGASAYAPENTLAAIREAHRRGCRWVEIDVKLTADAVPILMHDDRLGRTTSGRGAVRRRRLDEIRTLDAGSWKGRQFAGEPVPTFAEALELLRSLGMAVNVEIKPCRGREVETAWQVCRTLDGCWPDADGNVLLSSFAIESLRAAGEVAPRVPRGLLAEALPRRWRELMAELGCRTLHLSHRRVSERALAAVIASGTPVLCYTVNDPGRARHLRALGVTSVISDAPDLVAAALQ